MLTFLTLDETYNLVFKEESQRALHIQSQPFVETNAMTVLNDGKRSGKGDLYYSYCGKNGHAKEKYFKIIGFLADFKFIKNKENARKILLPINSVLGVTTINHNEEQIISSMSQLSLTKNQVKKLMAFINEHKPNNKSDQSAKTLQSNLTIINSVIIGIIYPFFLIFNAYFVHTLHQNTFMTNHNTWIIDIRALDHITCSLESLIC